MNRLFGKIACMLLGHKRGKRIAQSQAEKTYRCPRCAATWTRKVRAV